MNRADVIARLRAVEPALRKHGVSALYLFGSYSRDQAEPGSDIDVFVEAAGERLYSLSNYMAAYRQLRDAFTETEIGYSTRDALSRHVRPAAERDAIRVF